MSISKNALMERVIRLPSDEEANILFGRHDENLKFIKQELTIQITARGEKLTLQGEKDNVILAEKLMTELINNVRLGKQIHKHEIDCAIGSLKEPGTLGTKSIYSERIEVMSKRQFITPKTKGQKSYVDAIAGGDITFGIGPAGTGK